MTKANFQPHKVQMSIRLRHTWLLSLFFTLMFPSQVLAESAVIDISRLSQTLLRDPVQFVEADQQTPFSEIPNKTFSPLTDKDINQGVTDRAFWLRMRLDNPADHPVTWILSHETSYIDHMQVHYRDAGAGEYGLVALSDREPFYERPLNYRTLGFRHTTRAGSYTDLYVKVYFEKADSISLNFPLREQRVFTDNQQQENLLFGIYYGAMLTLIIIALSISLMLRKVSALIYGLLLIATSIQWLLFNGYGFQYLWPNNTFWQNEGFHIIFLLFAICALEFSKAFLKLASYYPGIHKLFTALQIVSILGIVLRFAGLYVAVLHISFIMLAILALVLPWAGWLVWRKGWHYARWYTYAWLVYSTTLLLALISAYSSWLSWGMQPLLILQLGTLVEAALLMVAMTERLIGIENDRRQALAIANQDHLTGLGNRRLLQMEYEKFKERYYQEKTPVFLIMIDLDHFKVINDTYGHDAGDAVLKHVAQLLKSHSRSTDVCIRYGGEEFALLLRADSLEEVWGMSERIRVEFERNPTQYQGLSISHTLSSGITSVLCQNQTLTVNEMMQRADAALYQGKEAGRNRNTVYDEAATNSKS